MVVQAHLAAQATKGKESQQRRKNQLKQQEPHTYPLREVLRQQASPERVQALGCVGMRAS